MTGDRYLIALVVGAILWVGGFFVATLVVDPYGVSPLKISAKRINELKPKRVDIDRLIKPYEVWRYQPRTIFLGTSRIHQSMDPSVLDGTSYAPAYNASIPASTLGMNVANLKQYINFDKNLKTVFIELFFWNFIGQGQEYSPKSLGEYIRNTAQLFISADALFASWQTFHHNIRGRKPRQEIRPGGFYSYAPGHYAKGLFDGFPAGIYQLYKPMMNGGMQLHDPAFEVFQEIIDLCHENKIELIFLLTPNHAYDDYFMEKMGEWPVVEQWLTRLVATGATIYSFSQPNRLVYEPVTKDMQYWNDPFHFSLEMGRSMQQSLSGAASRDIPENFMLLMTEDQVQRNVRDRREAVREWAKNNQDFVRQLDEEFDKAKNADASKKDKQ